jgi:hypothetical protein
MEPKFKSHDVQLIILELTHRMFGKYVVSVRMPGHLRFRGWPRNDHSELNKILIIGGDTNYQHTLNV